MGRWMPIASWRQQHDCNLIAAASYGTFGAIQLAEFVNAHGSA